MSRLRFAPAGTLQSVKFDGVEHEDDEEEDDDEEDWVGRPPENGRKSNLAVDDGGQGKSG